MRLLCLLMYDTYSNLCSSAAASSMALRSGVIFSVASRLSLVSSRFRSILMMFEGPSSVSLLPIAGLIFANENHIKDAGHTFPCQSRNPKVLKNSGIIRSLAILDNAYTCLAAKGGSKRITKESRQLGSWDLRLAFIKPPSNPKNHFISWRQQ